MTTTVTADAETEAFEWMGWNCDGDVLNALARLPEKMGHLREEGLDEEYVQAFKAALVSTAEEVRFEVEALLRYVEEQTA